MIGKICQVLAENQAVIGKLASDPEMLQRIMDIAAVVVATLRQGNKVLLLGNGGSAADTQHFAAELIGRFKMERRALPAIALTSNTSVLTAIGNDYSFDSVFVRQVEALVNRGDVVIGISTSGKSENVLIALRSARELGAHVIGLTGANKEPMASSTDILVQVPSKDTARVQEALLVVEHIICEQVECAFVAA